MATQPFKDLNEGQRRAKRVIDLATDSVVNYKAKEVPPMGNLTVEGMVEELGYLNEARKMLEGTEKILKERLKSRIECPAEVKSDNFTLTYESRSRSALDQEKAKQHFIEEGTLPDYMKDSSVPTITIKAN